MTKRSLLACLILAALSFSAAEASIGETIRLPDPAYKGKASGYSLTLATNWVESPGMLPVRVTINSLGGAVPADHSFRLEFTQRWDSSDAGPHTTVAYLELPQGQTSGQVTILLPQFVSLMDTDLRLKVWDNGTACDDISAFGGRLRYSRRAPAPGLRSGLVPFAEQRVWTGVAYVSGVAAAREDAGAAPPPSASSSQKLPDLELKLRLAAANFLLLPDNTESYRTQYFTDPVDRGDVLLLRTDDLPDRWTALWGLTIIGMPLDEARQLAKQSAPQWTALLNWVADGGALLLITEEGQSEPDLADLQKLCSFAQQTSAPARSTRFGSSPVYGPCLDLGRGCVGVIPSGSDWRTRFSQWQYRPTASVVDVSTTTNHRIRSYRNSYSYRYGNPSQSPWPVASSAFGIPGVGQPPISAFYVLITLFVLVIGPLNYFLLVRWKRLYLMLLTVPLGALACTAGLVVYVLLADGLFTRVRVESLTYLDGSAGRATTWSRQAYFAAISPSGGLSFPLETVVYPMAPNDDSDDADRALPATQLHWGDQQRLASGFISSRQVASFHTDSAVATSLRLNLARESDGAAIVADNQLGVIVRSLLVFDDEGSFYFSDVPILAGESGRLAKSQFASPDPLLARLCESASTGGRSTASATLDWRHHLQMLSRWLGWADQQAAVNQNNQKQPRFIALVDRDPFVPLGLGGLREEASWHVITGNWSP